MRLSTLRARAAGKYKITLNVLMNSKNNTDNINDVAMVPPSSFLHNN
jgi:hypothetical protein